MGGTGSNMTASELAKYIGRQADWVVNAGAGVTVRVDVSDAREKFGRLDCLVCPIEGDGQCWVDSKNLRFDPIE